MRRAAYILVPAWLLCGCAGDGSGMGFCGDGIPDGFEQCDDGNNSGGDGCSATCALESGGIQPTLESIQANIFTPLCASCHYEGNGAVPMGLENADASYGGLVSVESWVCYAPDFSLLPRVDPGEPDRSCLVLKVEGSEWAGGYEMPPLPARRLNAEEIGAIRGWIEQGAPR
jgi:cysteine-rich repeat protein